MDTQQAEVEIGLTAAALQERLTLERAEAMAHQADSAFSGDWLIVESSEATACYRVWVEANSIGPPG